MQINGALCDVNCDMIGVMCIKYVLAATKTINLVEPLHFSAGVCVLN